MRAQVDDSCLKSAVPQDSYIPQSCANPGSVAVVSEQHPARIAVEQCGLSGCKSRSQRCDRLDKAGLVHGNDVHVALTEDQVILLAAAGQIQGVQIPPLVEDLRIRRIDVFGLAVAENSSAETDHPAPGILNGKHNAVPEPVVQSLLLIEESHIRLQYQFIRKSFFPQIGSQIISGSVRESQAESVHDLRRQVTSGKVPHAAFSPAGAEQPVIIGRRLLVDRKQVLSVFLALLGLFTHFRRRQCDICPVRQFLQCFRKSAVIVLHQEGDSVSARPAPEAVKHIFAGGHSE